MKQTLLEIVQDILNDLDSDEVNSINDTVEAQQVAQIVKSCYDELTSNRNWPHQKKLIQLDASGSLSKPNYMKLPEGTKELISLKYNVAKLEDTTVKYRDVQYKYPDEFLTAMYNRDSSQDNVQIVIDTSGVELLVRNDKAPEFWTSFDDNWLVFDSYDAEVDTTLKKSKTQAMAYVEQAFVLDDDFIPDIPSNAFALLREEAKSTAFLNLKQMANPKAEAKAQRQNRWLSRKAWKAHGGIRFQDYGRGSRK